MTLRATPLGKLHHALGARMVEFAGYEMPVQYPNGIISEHLHTRNAAGLFDVSHMGQVVVHGDNACDALESMMPADLTGLPVGSACYSFLLNSDGGVLDDLIVNRLAEQRFFFVLNAANKAKDLEHLRAGCPTLQFDELDAQGLLALQGPSAREVMGRLVPAASKMVFMTALETVLDGIPLLITCSGYTGEDGFELSVPPEHAAAVAQKLLDQPEVAPVGLGARDSLRLEAGLCLHGQDLDGTTTPVEAGLRWAIAKQRRVGGERAGGYPGAEVINQQLAEGPARVRVGLEVEGKRPIRAGQVLSSGGGMIVGNVTSGSFGATVGAPVAMGYVTPDSAQIGTELQVEIRGAVIHAKVVSLPMVPAGYYRG